MVQPSAENIYVFSLLIAQFPGNYANETRKIARRLSTEYQDYPILDTNLFYILFHLMFGN